MKFQKVVWYEGMKLDPHHFQQADRYNQYYINSRLGLISPNYWGLNEFQIDSAALAGGSLGLIRCNGIMPDGCVFNMPENDPLRVFESASNRAVVSHVEHAPIEDVHGSADPAFGCRECVAEDVFWQPKLLAHRLRQNSYHKTSGTQGSLTGKIRWELLWRGWAVEPTNLNAELSEDPSCPVLRLAKNMRVYLCVIVNPQSQGPGSVGC